MQVIDAALTQSVKDSGYTWLITGVAGFIGSNLLEQLLKMGQKVTGFDNFSTGNKENLKDVERIVGPDNWKLFTFVEGDIRDKAKCAELCSTSDVVLHQAALGSVTRSLQDPLETHEVNLSGFLTILTAVKQSGIKRFVYASSSSVYGDNKDLPKVEENTGKVLSPYAATKKMCEIYAEVYAGAFKTASVGLRYFNVFGPRQDPAGPYAAVIPRWIDNAINAKECEIFGDGKTSRDFSYIENVVEANLRAALSDVSVTGPCCVLNVGNAGRTTLLELYDLIVSRVATLTGRSLPRQPKFSAFRAGDVRHSLASIEKARQLIGYQPTVDIEQGIARTVDYHLARQKS